MGESSPGFLFAIIRVAGKPLGVKVSEAFRRGLLMVTDVTDTVVPHLYQQKRLPRAEKGSYSVLDL
jgi:hypothetical protein